MQTLTKIESYETIICGAGPAGISCALGLHEQRIDYLLLERAPRIGGQLQLIDNALRDFASCIWQDGNALRKEMEAQCIQIGLNIRTDQNIENVDLANKIVTVGATQLKARSLFLATGARVRTLRFKGDQNAASSILYESEKQEELLSGKSLAIIGGGDNALMDAVRLADKCPSVLVINRSAQFKARPDVVRDALKHPRVKILTLSEVIELIQEDGQIKHVCVLEKESLQIQNYQIDFLLIRAGYCPNSELFEKQLEMDDSRYVLIDLLCQTSISGVYAGGDLVAPAILNVAKAVGQGSVAAQAISQYLRQQAF